MVKISINYLSLLMLVLFFEMEIRITVENKNIVIETSVPSDFEFYNSSRALSKHFRFGCLDPP